MDFTLEQIPQHEDKIAIITGANTGLGFENTKQLADKGVRVVMACRNKQKAEAAKAKILKDSPNAQLDILIIDLSSLKSVRAAAKEYLANYDRLDILINNAGVMIPPYHKTEDGFELQMAANHFGHFLFTGLLLDLLNKTPNARIVSLSSLAHTQGTIHFDNLHWETDYSKLAAYQQSKLACILFALEMQRRLETAGHSTVSLAAHPGVSNTELARHIPKLLYYILYPLVPLVTHSPYHGALPATMAAIHPKAKGGDYFGPVSKREMKGKPGYAKIASRAKDKEVAKKLWEISEQLTGIKFL